MLEGKNIAASKDVKTANPYVVLALGPIRERTKTAKKTLSPQWKKEIYYFYVPAHYANLALEIDAYNWNRFGRLSSFVDKNKTKKERINTNTKKVTVTL